eukprot:3754001-Pyramimonas_sp.AAC.1
MSTPTSAHPSRGSRPLRVHIPARARQCPRRQAQRTAETPRRAPAAPKGSQRRARVVCCAEQKS